MNIEYIAFAAVITALGLSGFCLGLSMGIRIMREKAPREKRRDNYSELLSPEMLREQTILRNIESYGTDTPQEELK